MEQALSISKLCQAKRRRQEDHVGGFERRVSKVHRLPSELEFMILSAALNVRERCIAFHFGKCQGPWDCNPDFNLSHEQPLFLPDAMVTALCNSWRHEALSYFFVNNTFIFNNRTYLLLYPLAKEGDVPWSRPDVRDQHATRMLDFIDRPDWKGIGSRMFQHHISYPSHLEPHIDSYRHLIRKLALIFDPSTLPYIEESGADDDDMDWVLKVDWKSLPHLETLYLDFQWTSARLKPVSLAPNVVDCAQRMRGLSLKKLVLMNVDWGSSWLDSAEQERHLRRLFKGALRSEGEIEIHVDDSSEW